MKILAISDVDSNYIYDHFNDERFINIDIILAAGDLSASYLSYVATMFKAPVYFVHGNHDRYLIDNPPEGCFSLEDKVIQFKGYKIAGLGGSMSYTGGDFQFTESEMRRRILRNRLKYRKGIDILLTHSPAYQLGDGKDLAHTGFKIFRELLIKHTPLLMVHGHQHLSYARQDREIHFESTRIINAYNYTLIDLDEPVTLHD